MTTSTPIEATGETLRLLIYVVDLLFVIAVLIGLDIARKVFIRRK